jgi:RNA polymerase primary sigma factor
MARAQQAVQKTEDKDQAAEAPERDSPLLDLSDQAVKRLLK